MKLRLQPSTASLATLACAALPLCRARSSPLVRRIPTAAGPRAAPLTLKRGLRGKPERSVDKNAVVVADEGASYNPNAEAHQALIQIAVKHEMNRLAKQR